MRKHILNARRSLFLFAMIVVLGCSSTAFAGVTIQIINLDGPGEGFNDPTPAAPVGGNTGTTLGEQRLIAFQFAANIWGATLDSNQVIRIQAAFNPLGAGVLGSAGAIQAFANFPTLGAYPGPEFLDTWYGSSLANKRAGFDLNTTQNEINAQFSSNFNFYLGLDNNHGALPDLVAVLLHEFGHGLNFQTFVNPSSGINLGGSAANPEGGLTDIYARHLLDISTGLHWNEMTSAQRQAAATRFGRVVWDGATVTADVPNVLVFGNPDVRINSPASIVGSRQFGTAAFGPTVGNPNVTADVVAAVDPADAAGPATTDGCSPFTNAVAVAGKIALIERGTCGFAVKARNATIASAVGVIIYNNAANANAAPPGMADDGINGQFVTIPTVSLIRADGTAIVGELNNGPVNGSLIVDPTVRAGADALGRARLYAPFPVVGGSSISHYDTVAFRNLLMEPAINGDLTHNLTSPDDLTLELMRDVGWFPDADVDGIPDGVDFLAAAGATLTNESCPNGQIDPGERVTVRLNVSNSGPATTNLVGTLQTAGGVIAPSDPQTYGVIPSGGSKSLDFSFTASSSLTPGQTITATLQLQDGASNKGLTSFTFTAGPASCNAVRLVVKSSLTRIDATTVQASITVENIGSLPADNASLTTARLGVTNGTPLPQALGSIAPGASASATVQFTNSSPGASSTLSAGGTYNGGSFSGTKRVTIP